MNGFALSHGANRLVFWASTHDHKQEWVDALQQTCRNLITHSHRSFLHHKYNDSTRNLRHSTLLRQSLICTAQGGGATISRSPGPSIGKRVNASQCEQTALEYRLQRQADLTDIFAILEAGTLPTQSGMVSVRTAICNHCLRKGPQCSTRAQILCFRCQSSIVLADNTFNTQFARYLVGMSWLILMHW